MNDFCRAHRQEVRNMAEEKKVAVITGADAVLQPEL